MRGRVDEDTQGLRLVRRRQGSSGRTYLEMNVVAIFKDTRHLENQLLEFSKNKNQILKNIIFLGRMDPLDFILAICAGLISSFLIVGYTLSESERKKINNYIDLLFSEIEFNRNKIPTYSNFLSVVKTEWERNKKLQWINHNEISTGYGGFLYNFLKFDTYNLFTIMGINLYFDTGLDYSLKLFYYDCKNFCASTQNIENQMRIAQRNNDVTRISTGFNEIEREFKQIADVSKAYVVFSIQNKQKFKFSWIDWHIKRVRIISESKMNTIFTRLKTAIIPFGRNSLEYLLWGVLSIILITVGCYLISVGNLFSSDGSAIIYSAGFFLMSFGLAVLLFAINQYNALSTKTEMKKILTCLKSIDEKMGKE